MSGLVSNGGPSGWSSRAMLCWLKRSRSSCHSSCWSWTTAVAQAEEAGGGREDPHDLGPAVDLGVQPLDMALVLEMERHWSAGKTM